MLPASKRLILIPTGSCRLQPEDTLQTVYSLATVLEAQGAWIGPSLLLQEQPASLLNLSGKP